MSMGPGVSQSPSHGLVCRVGRELLRLPEAQAGHRSQLQPWVPIVPFHWLFRKGVGFFFFFFFFFILLDVRSPFFTSVEASLGISKVKQSREKIKEKRSRKKARSHMGCLSYPPPLFPPTALTAEIC